MVGVTSPLSAPNPKVRDVTSAEFKRSLADQVPPTAMSRSLAALWWAKKGKWDTAHALVMDDADGDGAWVHAYLHRLEGDLGNARYWYRQAQRSPEDGSLETEWELIVGTLLDSARRHDLKPMAPST